jgi:hypothetical protein
MGLHSAHSFLYLAVRKQSRATRPRRRAERTHLKAKSISFELVTNWHQSDNTMVFKDVPVEQ